MAIKGFTYIGKHKDGGTIVVKLDNKFYSIDHRIRTTTPGKVYTGKSSEKGVIVAGYLEKIILNKLNQFQEEYLILTRRNNHRKNKF